MKILYSRKEAGLLELLDNVFDIFTNFLMPCFVTISCTRHEVPCYEAPISHEECATKEHKKTI